MANKYTKQLSEENPCVSCQKITGQVLGRGMCASCYQKLRRQEKAAEAEKIVEEFPPVPTSDDFVEDLGEFEKRPGSLSNPSANLNASETFSEDSGSLSDKVKSFFGGSKASETPNFKAPKTSEQKPKAYQKRVSGADSISDAWSAIGGLISRNPRHRPSGMLLQWQSAAAGEIIDEAVKGTAIDRLLIQRAVKARSRFDLVGAVFFPPAIVFAIEMNPERAPMLLPLLESTLRSSLPHMVPAVKKARKREADQAEAIRELFPDAPEGTDPVRELINELFATFNYQPEATPNEPEEEYEQSNRFE